MKEIEEIIANPKILKIKFACKDMNRVFCKCYFNGFLN